jgi:hypothetical protein
MKCPELVKRIMMNVGALFFLFAVFFLATMVIPDTVRAAGARTPAEICESAGDSEVSMKISDKVVANAIKKWEIADLVDEEKIQKASKDLYEFLKWKLGSPLLICTQYYTDGQKYFDKKYNDEAVAALLGTEFVKVFPGDEKAEIRLSKGYSEWLQSRYGFPPKTIALERYFRATCGWGKDVAENVMNSLYLSSRHLERAVDRIDFRIPKTWDLGKHAAKDLIAAKRKASEK